MPSAAIQVDNGELNATELAAIWRVREESQAGSPSISRETSLQFTLDTGSRATVLCIIFLIGIVSRSKFAVSRWSALGKLIQF